MSNLNEKNRQATKSPSAARSLWITLEAEEIIELKRIGIDRDGNGAVVFFYQVLLPHLHKAALKRGILLDVFLEVKNDEHLPG